ncbi:hypothetical protein BUALT_Bualt05G0059500 [Buddleja alternifolia]|uniref:MBD domain-containing protein n=1 Tax=Buddleja alternifolia TaxID=168488 RepID=A0AAV6XNV8_9LAMI|nr:hypothetical protein BUALT_Bualt05G0059500 [Buddleja alternifolia]
MVDGKSPEWLPPGFTEKFKYKNGRKIKYYYNVATGEKYHSKKDVISATTGNVSHGTPQTTNDDNGFSSNNKVDAISPEPNDSPDPLPSGWTVEEKARNPGGRKGSTYKLDNVDEPLPDMSLQLSMTSAGSEPEKKKKDGSFKPVASVSTPADGLPPGWIKEIITSKSGSKIRRDPFYTDPVSGHVFRSKPDALRFLKTGDIRYCASRPKTKDYLQLIKNEIPSSNPDNGNASEDLQVKGQLFLGEETNGGGEISLTKIQADSNDNNESGDAKEVKQSCGNSNENAEKENNSEPSNEVSKQDPRIIAKDVITDSSTDQKLPESGMEKQTDKSKVSSGKFKKRREEPSLPSRASKRFAKCESETLPGPVLNERALKAAARNPSGGEVDTLPNLPLNGPANIPLPSNIEAAKEEKPLQETEPLNKIENPLPIEDEAIPEEQKKQVDETKKSQLCYGFEGSWSDPCLEFAFKTLTGEISIEDTLLFPGCFEDQQRPSQSDLPNIFQREVVPHSGSSAQHGGVDQLPANPLSFSAQGNSSFPSFSGFNSQSSSTEVGNKDLQTKFNP